MIGIQQPSALPDLQRHRSKPDPEAHTKVFRSYRLMAATEAEKEPANFGELGSSNLKLQTLFAGGEVSP